MAISTSIDFNQTQTEIITDALGLIQVLSEGETASPSDYALAKRVINRMFKAWQTQGIHLFGQTEGVLVPVVNQSKYSISSATTSANIAKEDDFFITSLSAAEASGQTVLSTTLTTNISASDKIGITLADGTIFWTTVVSKTSTEVTITDALTGAANSGAKVYTYTTRIDRPVRILSARAHNVSSSIDTDMKALSREDYMSFPNKTSTGHQPLNYYYDPQITTAYLHIWPVPSTITHIIKFTYQRQITDIDQVDDNPDFPQEWLDAIVYSTAVRLGPFFGRYTEAKELLPLAATFLEKAMEYDNENTSLIIKVGD